MAERFHLQTLGCPKNVVDSEKLAGALRADGMVEVVDPADADLVVVNTCGFVEAARAESVEAILDVAATRRPGARLVVTGCLAERCGPELGAALPEIDAVVPFAAAAELAPVVLRGRAPTGVRDLLELPRPAPRWPWAYLKVAEGCDRACAFCAIPSFRGPQRSRRPEAVVDEAATLVDGGVRELVLVAQDLAAYGRDAGAVGGLVDLLGRLERLAERGLRRLRLLYLYPSEVRGSLLEAMVSSPLVVPYFDLSFQHVGAGLLRRMRRWGHGERFLALIEGIRCQVPDAAFRSSFIVGFPGETEDDHTELGAWLQAAELDWAGFFAFSREDGTAAAGLDGQVPAELAMERLRELTAIQDPITAAARDRLLGSRVEVLVDRVAGGAAVGRTHREAPEIDGEVHLDGPPVAPGAIVEATVTGACGPDLRARPEAPVPTA